MFQIIRKINNQQSVSGVSGVLSNYPLNISVNLKLRRF